MTALYWVRSDKSKAWIPRECGVCEYGFRDLLTGTIWSHGQPVKDGHPDERIDAMFRAAYRQPAPVPAGPPAGRSAGDPRPWSRSP